MIFMEHLETDLNFHCQLSCACCNHHVVAWRHAAGGPRMTTPEAVARDLNHLATFVHARAWGALGGEPLLHPQLVDILRAVRASGVSDRIEVWTNGIAFPRVASALRSAPVDEIVLSRYEGKLTDAEVEAMQDWCCEEAVLLTVKDHRAGRAYGGNFMTLLEPVPTGPEATRAKFAGCFFRQFSRNVTDGFFFTCCCAPSMPFLIQGRPFGSDGVAVAGLTEDGLRAYLDRTEPLGACTVCAGRETATPVAWHEERDPVRWLAASAGLQAPVGATEAAGG